MYPSKYSELREYIITTELIYKYVKIRKDTSTEKRKLYYIDILCDHVTFYLSTFAYSGRGYMHNLLYLNMVDLNIFSKDEFIRICMKEYIHDIVSRWMNCYGVTI